MRVEIIHEHAYEPVAVRATWLGYGGLLPFAFAALIMWLAPYYVPIGFAGAVMQWELFYGAIILSFMGGVRWGLAMMEPAVDIRGQATLGRLTASVAPALIGWMALIPDSFIPFGEPGYVVRHVVLLVAFLYLMDSDLRAVRDGAAPAWYGPLRKKLTIFLALLMTLIILRLILWNW